MQPKIQHSKASPNSVKKPKYYRTCGRNKVPSPHSIDNIHMSELTVTPVKLYLMLQRAHLMNLLVSNCPLLWKEVRLLHVGNVLELPAFHMQS